MRAKIWIMAGSILGLLALPVAVKILVAGSVTQAQDESLMEQKIEAEEAKVAAEWVKTKKNKELDVIDNWRECEAKKIKPLAGCLQKVARTKEERQLIEDWRSSLWKKRCSVRVGWPIERAPEGCDVNMNH